MAPIEEQVVIATPDKKKIYTTLGYPAGRPKGMVVFIHGLASTEYWPPMLLGSWYFRKRGYAYCRVNLYDWREGARTLMSSDLLQHSKDTDTVVKCLRRRGYKRLFGVGHSFGGLTLLRANTAAFNAISLWDMSSFISHPPKKWFRKVRNTSASYMTGSYELLMSERYKSGMENFPDELELASKIKVPTQIAYAAGKNATLIVSSKRYFENLNCAKELIAIPDTSHSFTEEGKANILFRKTEKWFASAT